MKLPIDSYSVTRDINGDVEASITCRDFSLGAIHFIHNHIQFLSVITKEEKQKINAELDILIGGNDKVSNHLREIQKLINEL